MLEHRLLFIDYRLSILGSNAQLRCKTLLYRMHSFPFLLCFRILIRFESFETITFCECWRVIAGIYPINRSTFAIEKLG